MRLGKRSALTSAGISMVLVLITLGAVAVAYVSTTQGASDQLGSQSQQIATLQSELQKLSSEFALEKGTSGVNLTLPVMNQAPTIRTIQETWYLSPAAHQDRFEPSFIIVNQGDTVRLTLIDNDTVAHDFVIGPKYNIIVNATVPGLIDDLTGQKFTTPSRNNSPGVVVTGDPGNVSAKFSFVAIYSGIYEFVCTYHAQVGMIGYLVVLPNKGYTVSTTTGTGQSGSQVSISIPSGSGINTSSRAFSPNSVTLVMGVNNTVTWTNNDNSPHTVTSDGGVTFDSGNLAPGQTYTFTFTQPGTYTYHCTYHPWMVGTIVVKAAS